MPSSGDNMNEKDIEKIVLAVLERILNKASDIDWNDLHNCGELHAIQEAVDDEIRAANNET